MEIHQGYALETVKESPATYFADTPSGPHFAGRLRSHYSDP